MRELRISQNSWVALAIIALIAILAFVIARESLGFTLLATADQTGNRANASGIDPTLLALDEPRLSLLRGCVPDEVLKMRSDFLWSCGVDSTVAITGSGAVALDIGADAVLESTGIIQIDTIGDTNGVLDETGNIVTIHMDVPWTAADVATQALALSANGANCAANEFNKGVDEAGVAEDCAALVDADVPNDITIDLAALATALAANGANCAANTFPKGVDASGASESCTSIVTGDITDNTILPTDLSGGGSFVDEQCITHEATGPTFETVACAGATNSFGEITPTSGDTVTADSPGDTLILTAGTGITATGTGGTNTITIASTIVDTNADTECSGTTTYFDGEGSCDTLDGVEDFETATDDGILIGNGATFDTVILTDCDDTGGNHLNYDTGTNAVSCGTSSSGASGDITDVGPGCPTGACFTDGLATSGSTGLVWEGTSVDANDFTIFFDDDVLDDSYLYLGGGDIEFFETTGPLEVTFSGGIFNFRAVTDHFFATGSPSSDVYIEGTSEEEAIVQIATTRIGTIRDTLDGFDFDNIAIWTNTFNAEYPNDIVFMLTDDFYGGPRVVYPTEGADLATYNPGSLVVGPTAGTDLTPPNLNWDSINANILCSTNFSNIDCDNTGGGGSDLGVTGDAEIIGGLSVISLDCSSFANGGAVTVGVTGSLACSDDDAGAGAASDSFVTWDTPLGTDLVADSDTDTVTFDSPNSTVAITGTAASDTISFDVLAAPALSVNPADCAANQFAIAIDAEADLTCAAIVDADVPNTITIDLAATATALAADPADCAADTKADAIDAEGDLTCSAVDTGDIEDGTIVFNDISYTIAVGSNPSLGINTAFWGSTGIIFEGGAADTIEGLLQASVSSSDKVWTLPNTTGVLITDGDTGTVTSTMLLDGSILPADLNDGADTPADTECLAYDSAGPTFEWVTCGAGGSSNSFETMNVPLGTDPVAESGTDTLNWTSTGSTITLTGDSATDTINVEAVDVACTGCITSAKILDNTIDLVDISYVNELTSAPLGANETFFATTGVIFEGATSNAFETLVTLVDPTADRTLTLPNVSGNIVTTGDTGTVTSTMILNDTIWANDINYTGAGEGALSASDVFFAPDELVFEGPTADTFEGRLTLVDPTLDRTWTLPNVSGNIVTTGDTDTVTSTMILQDTIWANDINMTGAGEGPLSAHDVFFEVSTFGAVIWEGDTADLFEGHLTVVDPTDDRTWTLPDHDGFVVTTGDVGTLTSAMLLDGTILPIDLNDGADTPADEDCLTYEETAGPIFEWQPCGAGGSSNSFETWAVPAGTNPVADSDTDTITLIAGANVTITGDATADSVTIAVTGSGSVVGKKSLNMLYPTLDETNKLQYEYGSATTITEVSCSTDTGTVTVQLDERARATPNTAGVDILTAALTCDSDSQTTTSFTNAGIAADVPVNLQITGITGSPTRVAVHVKE